MLTGLIIGLVCGVAFTVLWFKGPRIIWLHKPPELPAGKDHHGGAYREPGRVVEDAPAKRLPASSKFGTAMLPRDPFFDPQVSYEDICDSLDDEDEPEYPRTSKDAESLTDYELGQIREHNRCPDCGHEKFLAGPRGGMAQNFKCANPDCGSRFNDMGPFGIDRISDASPERVLAS